MPTFNGAKFIAKSINSVLRQTFKDFELIIINDGSSDKTKGIIKAYRDQRIVYIENKKNLGTSKSRNIGLNKSKGKYIAYCDHDDIYYPHHLKVLAEFLERHPGIGLVYGDSFIKIANNEEMKKQILYSEDFDPYKLEIMCFILPLEVMHRKKCLVKSGWFDESSIIRKHSAEDWDLWLRISDYFTCYHINKPLGEFVFHGHNRSFNTKFDVSYEYVIRKRLKNKDKQPNYTRKCCLGIVNNLLYHRNFNAAKEIANMFYRIAQTPESRAALGLCDLAKKDFKPAVRRLRKSLSELSKYKERRDFLYRYNLGLLKTSAARALSFLGHFDEAGKQLKSCLGLARKLNKSCRFNYGPGKEEIWAQLALLYVKAGLYPKALEASQKCNLYVRCQIKGICYFNKKLYKKAISAFKKCVELNKIEIKRTINYHDMQRWAANFPLAYYNIGLAYYKISKLTMARNFFKKALKINPNFLRAKAYLEYIG